MLMGALLVCSSGALAKVSPGITFLIKSGEKVSFVFSEKPVIITGSETVSVFIGGTERVSFPYADLGRILFEDVEMTAIEMASVGKVAPHVVFLLEKDILHGSGLKVGERVCIYSLYGKLVSVFKADDNGNVDVLLPQLSKGVFVVHTQGGISYKFMNRWELFLC